MMRGNARPGEDGSVYSETMQCEWLAIALPFQRRLRGDKLTKGTVVGR